MTWPANWRKVTSAAATLAADSSSERRPRYASMVAAITGAAASMPAQRAGTGFAGGRA